MEEKEGYIIIQFKEKAVALKITEFDTDIDTEQLLKIDYSNIIGEILTFPVIINRIGILRAELQNRLNTEKFDCEVYKAKISEMFRKNKSVKEIDAKGKEKWKSPTVDQLTNLVLLDEGCQLRNKKVFRVQKDYEFLDALYWAAKDKSKKLDYFGSSLKPEDMENSIIEGTINGVLIKVKEKLIK